MIGQVRYGPLDLCDWPYVLDPEANLGAAAPDLATVSRLLSDGDVVAGERSGNGTIELPLSIAANSRAEFAAAEAALFREVNKPTNILTVLFGAGDGLPVVADTYRGSLVPTHDAELDEDYTRSYVLSCPREPFFRSPDPVVVAPSTASVVVDGFDSTTGMTTSSAASVDTTTFVTSTGSVRQGLTVTSVDEKTTRLAASWGRSVSSLDLSGMRYVLLWLLTDMPYTGYGESGGLPPVTLTLSSAGGSSTWSTAIFDLRDQWTAATWDLSQTPVATVDGGVDLAAVTGWSVTMTNVVFVGGLTGPYTVWADDLRAYPHGSMETTAGSAQLFFSDVEGAARTPVSLEVDAAGNSGGLLIANTPNPPVGYDPVLLAVTATPPSPSIVVTRKAVTLRRPAPECSTYTVMVYGDVAADTWTVTATLRGATSSCARTILAGDPDLLAANLAGKALFTVGELTLPPVDVDPQNTGDEITITITSGQTMNGAWLVWAGGENVLALPADDQPDVWYLDAVRSGMTAGRLLMSNNGRAGAVDAAPFRAGVPGVNFAPGANHLLAVTLPAHSTPTTNPTFAVTLSYFSRWLAERTA